MSNSDDPFRSPPSVSPSYATQGNPSSNGLIIAVAVINYVFGGMQVACGACMAIFGGGFVTMMGAIAAQQEKPIDADGKTALAFMTAFVIGMGVVVALIGVPVILAGYGVQCRRQWGRILTIVLAVISAILGLLCLISLSPVGLVYAGYSIFTLVVLLNSDHARLFR